jgi:hypothetical protein
MRIRLLTALVLAAALPAAAAAATERPAAIGHPTRANAVVVRVSTGGGFVPVQVNLRALPSFTLYGDGTVVVPGPVIQIYPGPAISPLVRSRLSERQVQALLQRAQAAGLLARRAIGYGDMGAVGVSDMPTTTLIVNARGRHVVRSAYALGAKGSGRLSPAQGRARRALVSFIAQLPQGLEGAISAPHAIAVYVAPYEGKPQTGARRVRWPLASNLATAGKRPSNGFQYRCITVRGNAVTTLLATLRKANEQSQWIAHAGAARSFQVVAVPLLPDQRDCSALHR